jgi:parallel beta-helix repeat protein
MVDNWVKKGLALAAIVIFVCMSITPSFASDNVKKSSMLVSDGNTLYVGGSGAGNYTRIQDAINDAYSGDTVFVYDDNSPYYENIVIDKSIQLIGENRDTTIIDANFSGDDDVVSLWKNEITISGFTIRNSQYDPRYYAGISVGSDYNIISGNRFINNIFGIKLDETVSNTIQGNIFLDSSLHGLVIYSSTFNIISNNTFESGDGIFIDKGGSEEWDSQIIMNNTVDLKPILYYKNMENLDISGDVGQLILGNCTNCIIHDLFISDVEVGIQLGFSNGNMVFRNTIDNTSYGLFCYVCTDNEISHNIISDNQIGIWIWSSINSHIFNNSFINNSLDGIRLTIAHYNRIFWNTISDNNCGIYINGYYWIGSHENVIAGNTLSHNYGSGICIGGNYGVSLDNHIYHNNFVNDTASDSYFNFWDASYPFGGNYWFDYTGEDNNGDGVGDTPYHIPGGDNVDRFPLMDLWSMLNQGPDDLGISGPTKGITGKEYNFTFNATDDNGDMIWYYINWGDNTNTGWIGPFDSGTEITRSHSWNKKGTYIIKVKAKDPYNAESQEATLEVTMPRNRAIMGSLFLRFLEQFPLLKRLLHIKFHASF